MNKSKSFFFPLLLTAFLLVGCKGATITPEEAADRVEAIETEVASEDYEAPTKFAVKQELRTNAFTDDTVTIKSVINFDLDAKYMYVENTAEMGEESEYDKTWIYYDAKNDRTYGVFDENGDKSHVSLEGDLFVDVSEGNPIEDAIETANVGALLVLADEDDNRNVYRSSGEGSLYVKIYFDGSESDAYGEVEISDYRLVLLKQYADDDNFIETNVSYGRVSTSKPNLNDYPEA